METIDAGELAYWEALYRIDPWGEDRADLRAGIGAAASANALGAKATPADFMPDFAGTRKRRKQSVDDMIRAARTMAGA